MEAPVDLLFRNAQRALTALGAVLVSAVAPAAALALLALAAQSDGARAPLLAKSDGGAGRTLTAAAD